MYPPIAVKLWPEIPKARRGSPGEYLATQPMIVRSFICRPEVRELVVQYRGGLKTYVIPALCTYPGRHSCGAQLAGHDPGDEDPVRP